MNTTTYTGKKELTGMIIGNWKVLHYAPVLEPTRLSAWLCECQCEEKTQKIVYTTALNTGKSKSCGCLKRGGSVTKISRDLIGKSFGKWTVLEYIPAQKGKKSYCLCRCDCEQQTTKKILTQDLERRKSQSCGCTKKIHDHRKAIRHCYYNMMNRCYDPNDHRFHRYGERGIFVCEEWKHDFESFFQWAIQRGYEKGLSLDRMDNDGPYSPENCQWRTMKEQQNNRGNNVLVEIDGKTKTLSEWADDSGIPYQTLKTRFRKGIKGADLLIPPRPRHPKSSASKKRT